MKDPSKPTVHIYDVPREGEVRARKEEPKRDKDEDEDERLPMLRAVARSEFGRRGYEATTVRDIASASGFSVGSVYRLIGSKDELLLSVMRSFTDNISAGWEAVLDSQGTTIEKLDAAKRGRAPKGHAAIAIAAKAKRR